MTAGEGTRRGGPLVGSILGRHLLVGLLGEGGMGAVYEAVHQDLGKRVAIKTLHEGSASSQDARQRFLREGRAAARIRHPNVADVYDVGIEGDQPYLVLELLEGEDLARLLAREGPLSVQRSADLLVPVVAAVAAAHELGVVHRDLKPENIFLSAERSLVIPKVLDFGISKLTERDQVSALTGTGALLGTPHYMSPEQAQGDKQIDARSDQYALGVILYQCVTGRRPMQGAPLYVLIQRIVQGDFPPPRQLNPSLPAAFEELILKAMARRPSRRFASTRALGNALLGFASERVRLEFGAELGGAPRAAVAAAAPLGARVPIELSRTLGESAQERSVPANAKRRSRWAVGLAVATLTLALGWRAATRTGSAPLATVAAARADLRVEPSAAGSAAPIPPALATAPVAAAAAASAAPAGAVAAPEAAPAPSPAERLAAEAERHLGEGNLALAFEEFHQAYTLTSEPRWLQRSAELQTRRWRLDPRSEPCRKARELWRLYRAAAVGERGRALAQSELELLGNCAERAPAPPAAPTTTSSTVPPPPSASAKASRPALPTEDPVDGFVDLEGN